MMALTLTCRPQAGANPYDEANALNNQRVFDVPCFLPDVYAYHPIRELITTTGIDGTTDAVGVHGLCAPAVPVPPLIPYLRSRPTNSSTVIPASRMRRRRMPGPSSW